MASRCIGSDSVRTAGALGAGWLRLVPSSAFEASPCSRLLGSKGLDCSHVSVGIELSERVLAHGAHVAEYVSRAPGPVMEPK
jgi:hypothetical protein